MEENYELEGQIQQSVGAVIFLIVGAGVAVLVLTFVGVLSGQTYELVQDDIDAITDQNIEDSIENAIESGFEALETTGDYLPIIVIALVMFMLLGIIVGVLMPRGMMGGGYGGAGVL